MYMLFNADKLPEAISSNLQGYSWSFSHFFLWRAFRLQLDCGEGAAIRLDDHVFRAEVLALSHGHSDHCRGLIGLLEARAGLMGDNDKPLTILYGLWYPIRVHPHHLRINLPRNSLTV
jgi:ribonuclease BN (tRNA processing enzyme)